MRRAAWAIIFLGVYAWGQGPGDWPEPRHNAHLTATQPMPGQMADAPAERAAIDLGRRPPSVTPVPEGSGVAGLALVHGALMAYDDKGAVRWTLHPPGINFEAIVACRDLDGDGRTDILLKAGRPGAPLGAAMLVDLADGAVRWRYDVEPMSYAWYLEAQRLTPGSEAETIIVCMMGYPPDPENGYIAVFDPGGDAGAALRWRYDFDQYTCFPTLLYPSLDGGKAPSIAVQTHSRMWIFDAATGDRTQFIQWDVAPANVRSYGRVEFTDLTGNGLPDFLCLADFAQHHEVLLNTDGVLEKAWHYGWPESVTTGKVVTTWPEPPYADLDGDGSLELVVSMFNDDGNQRWRVRVYDVRTGAIQYTADDIIAASLVDVTGDGVAEILGNRSADPQQSALTGAVALQAAETGGGGMPRPLREIWSDAEATAMKGRQPWSGASSRDSGHYTAALYGEHVALTNKNGTLRRVHQTDGEWRLDPWEAPPQAAGLTPRVRPPATLGPPAPELLAADIDGDGRNELITYSGGEVRVYAYRDNELHETGRFESSVVPVFADLHGDGRIAIVTAHIASAAPPRVRAVYGVREPTVIWETVLPAPDRTGLAHARLGYLRSGRFTGRAGEDIYLYAGTPLVRSVVLDGTDGALVWDHGEVPGAERYWAPTVNLASVYDFDDDGAEDLVFTNPDYYCIASGRTGEPLFGPAFPPDIFRQPSQGLYTLPVLLTRTNQPPLTALVAGHYFQGVMSIDAEAHWHRLPLVGAHSATHEGFMRIEDGAWIMGYGRQDGRFDCVDVSDGRRRWSLDLEATSSSVITCDVDGDGRFEFVFGTSHGALMAVGDGDGSPRIVWRLMLGAPVGDPIAADITGDGFAEIVVPAADGFVRVLGRGDASMEEGT